MRSVYCVSVSVDLSCGEISPLLGDHLCTLQAGDGSNVCVVVNYTSCDHSVWACLSIRGWSIIYLATLNLVDLVSCCGIGPLGMRPFMLW